MPLRSIFQVCFILNYNLFGVHNFILPLILIKHKHKVVNTRIIYNLTIPYQTSYFVINFRVYLNLNNITETNLYNKNNLLIKIIDKCQKQKFIQNILLFANLFFFSQNKSSNIINSIKMKIFFIKIININSRNEWCKYIFFYCFLQF